MVCIGIDVAKDKHDCFIMNTEGEVLADVFTISNNREGFESLLSRIHSCTTPSDKIKVGLEATGHYSYNKSPPPGPKKTVSSKTRNSDKDTPPSSPNFSCADIRQYKEHRQNSQIESWKSEALVEDEGDHANLEAVMLRGLLEECLHTTCGELSYQEFYTQRIELSKDTIIALRGRLGV